MADLLKMGLSTAELITKNVFENHYECSCGMTWKDKWFHACNDRCPSCDREIEPYYSIEVN